MTMEGPISMEEMRAQARIRHADAVTLVWGAHNAAIEEAWEVYEAVRATAQTLYEEESGELEELLVEELAGIAAGQGDPGPVPENEPSPAPDPGEPEAESGEQPFVDVPGPGVAPGYELWTLGPVEIREGLAFLTAIGHDLGRSPGEEKVIIDGLEALQEVIEAQGGDGEYLTRAAMTMYETKGGDHEID